VEEGAKIPLNVRTLAIGTAAAILGLLSAVPAAAGIILLNSGPGLSYSNLNPSGQYGGVGASGTTVATGAHPLWQPNHPDGSAAVWISYADTGYQGTHFQPSLGSTPVVTITDTFTTTTTSVLNLEVWADDSAGVAVDGTQVFAPIFTQGSACSGTVIGCLPQDGGVLTNYFLSAGTHTISFVLYQTGSGTDTSSNPMGLLFTGSDETVPEPSDFLLAGAGISAMVLVGRVRQAPVRRGLSARSSSNPSDPSGGAGARRARRHLLAIPWCEGMPFPGEPCAASSFRTSGAGPHRPTGPRCRLLSSGRA
jgi:hypothetical protein